jgi:hypothetical protein
VRPARAAGISQHFKPGDYTMLLAIFGRMESDFANCGIGTLIAPTTIPPLWFLVVTTGINWLMHGHLHRSPHRRADRLMTSSLLFERG